MKSHYNTVLFFHDSLVTTCNIPFHLQSHVHMQCCLKTLKDFVCVMHAITIIISVQKSYRGNGHKPDKTQRAFENKREE